MSAETLRKAAALMRERASGATESPWWLGALDHQIIGACAEQVADPFYDPLDAMAVANADHISSWHPAVALAVADWLDAIADDWKHANHTTRALRVALTYLGESA